MGASGLRELTVGAIFFGAMGLLGFYTVVIGEMAVFEDPTLFVVRFPDAAGLQEGNDVRISGVDVGKVDHLALHPEGGVVATLQIQRDLSEVALHQDYSVTIKPVGPLGGSYVDVRRGSVTLPELQQADYQELSGTAAPNALEALGEMVNRSSENVTETTRLIRLTMERVAEGDGTFGLLVNDPRLYESLADAAAELEQVTQNLNTLTSEINEGGGLAGRLLRDDQIGDRFEQTMTELQSTMVEARTTMENLASVTGKVDRGEGTIGGLINQERLHDELVALMENTNQTMDELNLLVRNLNEGKGSAGQFLTDDGLYADLRLTAQNASTVLAQIEGAEGPLGVMINDQEAAQRLRTIFSNVEATTGDVADMTGYIRSGQGNLGRLIYGSEIVDEARRTLIEFRESIEDVREQAPINAFIGAVMGAF